MTIYCGREFSPEDIQTIKLLIEHNPSLKRRPLSRKVCQRLGWLKPNGELKDMTCRVAMLRMHADGLITLPPAQSRGVRVKPNFPPTAASDPQTPLTQPKCWTLAPGVTLRPTRSNVICASKPSRLMKLDELKELKALRDENARLKRIVADQVLNIQVLKEVNSKKW